MAWFRRDVEQALSELNRLTASGPPEGYWRENWFRRAGIAYLTLGKFQAAEDMFRRTKVRSWSYAFVAWVRGDAQAMRERFHGTAPLTTAMVLRARAGGRAKVRQELAEGKRDVPGPDEAFDQVLFGKLARLEGRTAEAISLLEQGIGSLLEGTYLFFLGSESLAMVWLEQGDAANAVQVLDEASRSRGRRWPMYNGIFWQAVEWRRAQLYRQLGRHAEAEEVEATLRHLLTYADPDHRIRVALE